MRGPSSSGEWIGGQGIGENGISYLPGQRAYVCVSWWLFLVPSVDFFLGFNYDYSME